MASVSVTGIHAQSNPFFPLVGALARSPSYGEVRERFFFVGRASTSRSRSPAVAG